ncbi:MAG: bifunctional phosphopantothenoylcysteine decarboxylase/phosphopantothenate--cysteine ligase CoaBC [Cyclobacteriaceae bacterium]|nr:bifunctional phosphopantothenoylcysteine decarboxylase/phosphopantothenate--cysteine ligase CoaBC [Cyclobacteriaceae bacterium]
MALAGKKILLGVCGSIAAYKAALLIRLLVKQGADVKVIMTASAHDFITPLTLATLSKNPVLTNFSKDETGQWNNHVELGLWADVMVIAPASANTLAKMATGLCDNLLLATYLSARCPVLFAPAMDLDMWLHPATQSNLKKLSTFGNQLIEPTHGELASGLVGTGRMAEPEQIVEAIENFFKPGKLAGKKALVTAGPTYEAIDPVRFIGNHSTGKMGYALAVELVRQGADVTLVSGPTHLAAPAGVSLVKVTSADEMFQASQKHFSHSDIAIFSAAVADYRPAHKADQKIKKGDSTLNIELVKTYDIAAELGKQKKASQVTVGFALETENEKINAHSKLKSKNFDLIVLNSLNDSGAGFAHDTNKITLLTATTTQEFSLKSKTEVAADIVTAIIELIHA